MPGPQLPPLDLTMDERRDLTALVRRHTAPQQLVLRARIILLAADGLNNSQIARTLGLEADTVRLWRQRWQTWQAVALTDRSVARLYWALSKLDPETDSLLQQSIGIRKLLPYAAVLDFYGSHLCIRDGRGHFLTR